MGVKIGRILREEVGLRPTGLADGIQSPRGSRKKQQVPPLRFAPVGMTILLQAQRLFRRIYYGLHRIVIPTGAYPDFLLRAAATTTFAALLGESRMLFISASTLNRKSGGAQWRDLLFPCRFSGGLCSPKTCEIWGTQDVLAAKFCSLGGQGSQRIFDGGGGAGCYVASSEQVEL